jgi:RNA polymerase sigma factor (sigma-70 family)
MNYNFILTEDQQLLVEENMELVKRTIFRCIKINENVCGLGYDDLYQEGAVALCRAAATYDGVSAQFATYATTLIHNHLLDCCKAANAQQKHLSSLPVAPAFSDDEHPPSIREPSVKDETDELIDRMDSAELLARYKRAYSGIARLGIEALELKIKGFSGADIARLYNTEPNHVGAWISRAAKKMKADAAVHRFYGRAVEENGSES